MSIKNKFFYSSTEVDENYNFMIFDVSSISNPKNNSLIFLKKKSYELLMKLEDIKNSIIIIPKEMEAKKLVKNNIVIFSENPRLEYAILLNKILKKNPINYKLNFKDGYYFGENCIFGENVTVEPFVKIGNNVIIGDNTIIKAGTRIGNNVEIGKNCYIRENSVIGGEGFGIETKEGYKNIRIPHLGGVVIKDYVEIGALTTVCSGTIESTIIEEYSKIDDHVHIAHNVIIGKGSIIVAGSVIGGSTLIGERSWIGINSSIKNGLKLGKNIKLGMAAVVIRNLNEDIIVTSQESDRIEDVIKYSKYKKSVIETLQEEK